MRGGNTAEVSARLGVPDLGGDEEGVAYRTTKYKKDP